jgi:hypothetical protein
MAALFAQQLSMKPHMDNIGIPALAPLPKTEVLRCVYFGLRSA